MAKAPFPEPLSEAARRWLLHLARRALRDAMAAKDPDATGLAVGVAERPEEDPRLEAPARVFVSWHDVRELVGCIGSLEPWPNLEQAVVRYAVQAGLHDPRTSPARPSRWHRMNGEISILGEPQHLECVGFDAIAEAITPGRDGVILGIGSRQAVFLPVVWRQLPRPHDFLAALMRKAGLSPVHDGPRIRARVFLSETFGEPVVAPAHPGAAASHAGGNSLLVQYVH
ncbi:AmmeMemoRadiSam system protein A [Nannocystis sp. ILAH1]|uniref:AmmeMemoRadiSam system protein A n=1 Tax=unclassified Nannocystis TaxID=2627009 RepID=UPI00226FDE63|nr:MULTISPECIES: AmmeMemoRadiSam system protein A [unclassified Nannocystis]MCY0987502.1 AmmeMemoRadiSam system protein A [Nannocystis sp. ILAH1]MCY1070703.1 AmmeMemoRadiSam system protein A [Nannocystis sp. RBIL2]